MSCKEKALFMATDSIVLPFFLVFLVTPLTVGLNEYLVEQSNPKLADPIQTVPLPAAESESEPDHVPVTPPPAYQEATATDDPSSYADVRWGLRASSDDVDSERDAAKFVRGSAAMAVLLFLYVLLALCIQSLAWCSEMPTWFVVPFWVIFTLLCLAGVRGLGAYVILFRNLWGKRGREKFVVDEEFLFQWGLVLIALPYTLAFKGVRACQKHLCGQQRDEEDEDVELGVTPSSARFPPEARSTAADNSKSSEQEDGNGVVDEEGLEEDTAETHGLLSGQKVGSSSQ